MMIRQLRSNMQITDMVRVGIVLLNHRQKDCPALCAGLNLT